MELQYAIIIIITLCTFITIRVPIYLNRFLTICYLWIDLQPTEINWCFNRSTRFGCNFTQNHLLYCPDYLRIICTGLSPKFVKPLSINQSFFYRALHLRKCEGVPVYQHKKPIGSEKHYGSGGKTGRRSVI